MVDVIGNNIEFGSYVAYPVRKGSSMWMEQGEVIGRDFYPIRKLTIRRSDGRKVTTTRIDRVVTVKRPATDPACSAPSLPQAFNNAGRGI